MRPKYTYNPRVPRVCRTCGITFMAQPGEIRKGGGVYCSKNCQVAFTRPSIGETFGRLTIVGPFDRKKHKTFVVCSCTCGAVNSFALGNLQSGSSKSCGCLARDETIARSRTHGGTGTALFGVWHGMKKRCADTNLADYGGRGISVCHEWAADFAAFREWALAHGWRQGLDMDRIDNDGNYEPGNLRVVPRRINIRNRRTTRTLAAFGETRLLAVWAEDVRCLVSYETLHKRIAAGWDAERALSTPSRHSK